MTRTRRADLWLRGVNWGDVVYWSMIAPIVIVTAALLTIDVYYVLSWNWLP